MEREFRARVEEEERLGNIRTFRRDKELPPRFLTDWLQHQGFWVQIAETKRLLEGNHFFL